MVTSNYGLLLAAALVIGLSSACTTNRVANKNEVVAPASNQPNLTREVAIQRASHVSQVHYDLEFQLREKKADYSGQTTITFDYEGSREPLRIDFYQGQIRKLVVNDKALTPQYNELFIVLPASSLKVGTNTVVIQFQRAFSRDGRGFVRFEDPEDGRVYTYTDLEPFKPNRVFPCFDQPDLKATYTMKVTAPKTWHVITSVRESGIQDLGNDSRVWDFPKSAKFSTYIWSLHAGPYHMWEDKAGDIPLRLFARESLAKFVKTNDWFTFTKQGLEFFPKYFAYPYPYKKYDQLIVPEFNPGAMENVAAVTFSERFISRGPKSDRSRRGLANTILHEMAHMWFGDLVTMKWWNDLWLNESFATYMAHLALAEATEYKNTAWRSFHGTKQWAYWEDQLVTTHPIEANVPDTRQAFANFDGITYGKGASVLKQVAYFIGPEKFKLGVQNYFKKYAEKNTELKDFMGELSTAYGSSLDEWQKQWLQTSSLNTISVDLTCDQNKVTELKLSQSAPDDHNHLRGHRFKVALFGSRSGKLGTTDIFEVRLTEPSLTIAEAKGKACPVLVYPNYEDYGYLKVNLDEVTIKNLPQYIHILADPFQRQLFWSALWDMVRDSNLHLKKYADLALKGIAKEKDEDTLRDILNSLHGRYSNSASVLYYMPQQSTEQKLAFQSFAEKLERISWSKLKAAKAGSEIQKIWLNSVMTAATTSFGLSNIKALLEGDVKLKGLPIDQDKRWSIIHT
ncbi:MAG: aminopeptidase N, partial [Bdellovibrionales bacterium]|nr:aminopeptidase N [Bdellovibrionales bacterium]